MSSIYLKQLPEKFVNKYKRLVPPWGPVGLVTYKRTYSRQIEEGRTEDWHETVARCVNGALKIGLKMTDDEAFYLYDSVFNLRCTFSGRALWQLGTKTVERFGGDSLQNCWAVACDDPIEPFCFAFNELMLGGGVGFNIQREFVYEIPRVKFDVNVVRKDEKDVDYIVPDNREGWVDLLRRALSAFFVTGKSFSYSTICVRPKGAKINSFGGTASGPEDLCKGISEVVSVLKERAGKKLRPTDCLDIMNIIGSVVVAGNVRRCLPEGAMVHAKDGLIPIEKVKRGQLVLTRKGYKKVSNVFCQGIQKVIRIKTQDGHFDCTPNHKMCVMTAFNEFEWRIASELKPGDRIVSTRIAIDGGKTVLPAWSYDKPSNSTTCIDISIPDLDEDMAWFIGLFHADGYTYANRKKNGFNAYVSVVLSENEFEMAVRARDQMSRFGTGNVVLKHSKEEKSWKVTCQSKQLAWYLDDNVKKPKTEIRVPEFILGGTKEIRLAYVCGVMDGDGCCHNKPIQVLTTVYREFANDVQNLLYSCGIESRLGESDDEWESKKGWQKQFHVRLITTRSKLSLAHAGQSEKEIRIGSKSQYANGYPSSWFEFGFHGKLRDLAASAVDQVNVDRLERVLGPQDFIPVEVLEVSDDVLRLAETFDIEVEDEHEFFCNGYLTHNSAQLALGDIDDSSYLDAKNWEKGSIPNWRSMSNNSVVCNKAEYMHDKFWDTYGGGSEPYGLINLSNCRRFGRVVDGAGYRPDPKIIGTNPCLVGDTLVYVADGRGNVPIRQLSEEGKDVPVFCLDDGKKVVVRTMRHPRLTGKGQPILKITMEDGHVVRSTKNHKFLTSEGTYKEAKDLVVGDGLRTLTRYEASIKDIFPNANSRSQDYWWISMGQASTKSEHRIIAEFKYGRRLKTGEVVHHVDRNGKNNSFGNLEVMLRHQHDSMHGQLMTGNNNPMRRAKKEWSDDKRAAYGRNMSNAVKEDQNGRYCGQTNEDLKYHAIALANSVKRKFSSDEWKEYAKANGLPQHFSKWRTAHLGGISGLAKWAALEGGFENVNLDSRTLRFYKEVLSDGYDAKIEDGMVVVAKLCEECGKQFVVIAQRREVGFCSPACKNKATWRNQGISANRINGMRKAWRAYREKMQEEQVREFLDLKFRIGREPMKKEWIQACKDKGLSFEISRTTSPFRKWDALKVAAAAFNHKVVKIEADGEEDVYNGTVDEYHNFFVGGFDGETANRKHKSLYVNNLQCGEVPLASMEACNLAELFLPNIRDVDEFKRVAASMYKVVKAISCLPFIHEGTNEVVQNHHRLGISVTGFLQSGFVDKPDVFDAVYKHLEGLDEEYSKVLGCGRSIKLTTVKPSGTVSLLPGVTPGVHPAYAQHYIRRIRMASNDKLVDICRKHGYHVEPQIRMDGSRDMETMVVSFPIHVPDGTVVAKDVSAVKQLDYAKFLQRHWSDNSVSVTVYYKKEELPEIKSWLAQNYDEHVKTVSFLLHSGHGFVQAPYEEISAEDYAKLMGATTPITSINDEKSVSLKESLECAGGACPIK